MKTAEETKRYIVTCMELNMEHFMPGATQKALVDALACIERLEADVKIGQIKLEAAFAKCSQLEAERDALIEEMKNAHSCFACKKFRRNGGECCGGSVCLMRDFEWRGVQEEE